MPCVEQNSKEQLDFSWKVHGYTNEYIRFADQKAGIGLAIIAGLIATLFTAKAHHYCSPVRLRLTDLDAEMTLVGWTATISFAILLSSACLFLLAVNPRLWISASRKQPASSKPLPVPPTTTGLIFWGSVLKNVNAGEFGKSVSELTSDGRLNEVTAHIYVLADIADRKYWLVTKGIWLGTIGALFALACLFVIRT